MEYPLAPRRSQGSHQSHPESQLTLGGLRACWPPFPACPFPRPLAHPLPPQRPHAHTEHPLLSTCSHWLSLLSQAPSLSLLLQSVPLHGEIPSHQHPAQMPATSSPGSRPGPLPIPVSLSLWPALFLGSKLS